MNGGVEVTIYSHTIDALIGGQIGGAMGGAIGGVIGDLTERQIEVLDLLMEDNRLTYKAIARKLRINESAVSDHIKALNEKGAIKRIGKTHGNWQILIKQ